MDLVNEAKRQLEIHLRALTVLSRRWRTAERLATLVSKLLVDIEAPLVTGFGLLISEENEAGEKLFALLEIPEDMEAPMQAAACPVPHRSQVTQALPIPADDVLQFISGEDFELPE